MSKRPTFLYAQQRSVAGLRLHEVSDADSDLVALGREIRRHRKAKNLSQEELAERADMHRNYVGFLERGERNAAAKTLFKLARALDLSLAELFEGVR